MRLLACTIAGLLMAGGANAQASGNTGPTDTHLVGAAESMDFERDADGAARRAELDRDERVRETKRGKGARARAARPEEVTAGKTVRDSKGTAIGTVESASMSAAVVASEGGKVEVPLDSFGLDSKGLLIGIAKAEFDALVQQATQPAP